MIGAFGIDHLLVAGGLLAAVLLAAAAIGTLRRRRAASSNGPEAHSPESEDRRLGRREFIGIGAVAAGTAIAAAGGVAAGRALSGESSEGEDAAAPPDLANWENVRALFELEPNVRQLTAFLLAPHPRPVRDAIAEFRAGLDANPVDYLHENEERLEARAREAAGAYLGGSADEVALTDSTTMGLALMYRGLRLGPGDEIVTTEHDFYATHESLQAAAERSGASIRFIRLYDDPATASTERIVAAIARALRPRTRCLALTWVHSSSGVKLPLREIADAVRAANRGRDERSRVLLCVDGVHGFGVEDDSPAELGCDLFATGCHKWLFGPRGTGLVWGRPAAWQRLEPTIPSFDTRAYVAWLQRRRATDVPPGPLMTPGGFHSFEHRWALTSAFELHEQIGRPRIAERTRSLARRLKEGLAEIPRARVRTPLDERLSSGLVCFELDGLAAPDAVERLRSDHRVILSVTPYRTQYVRAGPGILNTPDDVDSLLEAVRAI